MTQRVALIGAGYTLQRFKDRFPDFDFHETHRDTLEAGRESIRGGLEFLDNCETLIFSLPPRFEALNLIKHLEFDRRAILLSSIGIYEKSDGVFDESANIGQSDRAQLIYDIESAFLKLKDAVVLRLGGLFDEQRHPINTIVKKQVPVQANERINFVHIDDVCQALNILLMNKPKERVYNLVDRNHPSRRDYYSSLTTAKLNFVESSQLDYLVSSTRFLDEFQTSGDFLDKVKV